MPLQHQSFASEVLSDCTTRLLAVFAIARLSQFGHVFPSSALSLSQLMSAWYPIKLTFEDFICRSVTCRSSIGLAYIKKTWKVKCAAK
jgi:hypothetical protein